MGQAARRKAEIKNYKEINGIVAEKENDILNISPLMPFINGGDNTKRKTIYHINRLNNAGYDSWQSIDPNKQHKTFIDALIFLCRSDIAVEKYGMTNAIKNREEHFINFTFSCIGFSTKVLLYIVKSISTLNLLSKITLARVMHRIYYECDDLQNDEGRKLTELCFENITYNNVVDMLEVELEKRKSISEPNLKDHMILEDAEKLKEALEKDEPFYLYRGFIIDEEEYVRQGKKEEGALYYKQDAGKGVSYTFDENVAGFFCYWNITFGGDGSNEAVWSEKTNSPQPITTKEEFIDYHGESYSLRISKMKKRPVVCRFLVDPKDIKGFNFGKSESEINLLPENLVVDRYELVSGRRIAELQYNTLYTYNKETTDLQGFYGKDKVVVLNYSQYGKTYQIFADGKQVEEKIADKKRLYLQNEGTLTKSDIKEVFDDAAIELPDEYKPPKLTKSLWDFLLRRPERYLHKKGHSYLIS